MNGTEDFAMTGSSAARTEQLAWLSELGSVVSKGQDAFSPVLARHQDGSVRMFAPPFHVERTRQPGAATLYYSQAPRSSPYSGFFQATYSSPTAAAFSQSVTTSAAETSRSYLQVENYQPLIGIQTVGSSHLQIPCSTGYLQQQHPPLPSSPTNPATPRLLPQGGRSLLAHSPDRDRTEFEVGPIVKETITSPPSCYRMPTGKEGSLKHRILRPPSISIVEPPPSALSDAPLSAPPIRSHREPSRSIPSSGYRSFSSSASSSVGGETRVPSPGTQLKYPQSFVKGAIIQLASNKLKHVENLTTEDFVECGAMSPTLRIDSSTVTSIEKTPATGAAKLGFHVGQNNIQITVEAPLEHPFFVYKQGWSSCSPERSAQRYGLACHKLKVGDTCVSITDKPRPAAVNGGGAKEEETKEAPRFHPNATEKTTNAPEKKTETRSDPPFLLRKRKRRWSAPDNVPPNDDDVSA